MNAPKLYQSIMVSSTFTDLKEHRQKAINSINKQGFHPEVMEFSGAISDKDVVAQSLAMVGNAAAYIGVISHKYGQTPECEERNPDGLSITELEFNEATLRNRPILLFIMSDEHPGKKSDFETDPEKLKKLAAFRERAKLMKPDGKVQRIYEMFDSVDDFASKAADAIALLTRDLDSKSSTPPPSPPPSTEAPPPKPPALRAVPRYRGSHDLVGRADQLKTLDEWASPANQKPLLLFEAMGGSGKSLLTWHWTTQCAEAARDDWAGRFWYSFYEKGAVMADFCRQALAYMTGKDARDFEQQPQSKLSEQLLAQLNARPWLLVLDGLERVLVAYHRSDAAQMRDEEADSATDQIGKRDPCRAIRHEDDDLLRALAGAEPSRILISSRLMPLALLSQSGSQIPGVRREPLAGLRPEDAEAMMRACGIKGDGAAMRAYLQRNCDCHPLVTGVIAGLIKRNLRAPGDFDTWVKDKNGGGALNLAKLDLKQRQNHILDHAIAGVDADERHILNLLSLFPRAAEYDVLLELAMKNEALDQARMETALSRLRDHGLVQYDDAAGGYDLHPVVRGVTTGRMDAATTGTVGDTLVDHFTAVPHDPWEQARTLVDVQSGIDLVATLAMLERYNDACDAYIGDLSRALLFNLEAFAELQQLLEPFFLHRWSGELVPLDDRRASNLLNVAALAIEAENRDQARALFERVLLIDIQNENTVVLGSGLANLLRVQDVAAVKLRLTSLAADLADVGDKDDAIFRAQFDLYFVHVECGHVAAADVLWARLDAMGRNWHRNLYRSGDLEELRARDLFYRNQLDATTLAKAEALAAQGDNRGTIGDLHWLRGLWHLACGEHDDAVKCFDARIAMARERDREDPDAESWRALAVFKAGGADAAARDSAERLSRSGDNVALAELWHELGDRDRALDHARRAHVRAVWDGEPYVRRYWLNRIRALYAKMGVEPPEVPVCDPAAHPPFAWEADVRALIDKEKAERAAREAEERK